jgi:superoxide reductase
MTHVLENTVDASHEKHVPQIEQTTMGYRVKVGSVPHPMEEAHYIEWIELIADGKSYFQYLQPGDVPQAEFCILGTNIWARAYCNLHGLWRS